jgi:two-component system chemotaxis response regulator CheB
VLVVQHMPAAFTGGFAARLDRDCTVRVVEAANGMPVERGTVYIAPGGERHMELSGGVNGRIRLRPADLVSGHRPSVDILFHSVAKVGAAAVGVILTGMGADGAEGLLAMRQAGARTLGQNAATCVVYGMPKAAFERGAVERELSLSAMPEAILAACRH